MTPVEITGAWLLGEDAYQWHRGGAGKFSIESDVQDLYKGLGEGGWEEIIYNRWSSIMLFHAEGPEFIPHTTQHLGKLAASARALSVALNCSVSPGHESAAFPGSNSGSWSSILGRGLPALIPSVLATPFDETKLGEHYRNIGLPLAEVGAVPRESYMHAKRLKEAAYELFGGYIAEIDDVTLIPRPGTPSGEILPWLDQTSTPLPDHS